MRPGNKRVQVASLEEEMETMQVPVAVRDLLRVLLVLQPEMRPSASEVLASDEYIALKKSVLTSADTK